jgi:hypothetical protein
MTLDEILFNALVNSNDVSTAVGGRIKDVCFEVGPDENDNTQLPYIIVTDGGVQNAPQTKDTTWESHEDTATAGIEVSADSPGEVRRLIKMARRAVAEYIGTLDYMERPELQSLHTEGVAWDWTKPCYFDVAHYQCDINNTPDE